ncbi:hypothetical protein [Streptomyces sp. NPDC059063]|uniref:hypothetical protein n=1 Tax=unclassified Streptomyces TaxID=2593676 RepID=UPI0036A711A2
MAITDDVRKTLSDPKPLYFFAGGADLAYQQAKKVPGIVERLASEAPARFEAVRNTDPREVQGRAAARAKEVREVIQTKVGEFIGVLDTDLKRVGEGAQDLALRGVGVAVDVAVQARDTYDKVAEHGEQTVKTWRGQAAEEISELADAVEPDEEQKEKEEGAAEGSASAEGEASAAEGEQGKSTAAARPAAKKAPAKKTTTAKKTTPPAK